MFKEQKLCKSIENKFIFIFFLIFIGYNCEIINCRIIKLIQILIVFINLILEIEESSITMKRTMAKFLFFSTNENSYHEVFQVELKLTRGKHPVWYWSHFKGTTSDTVNDISVTVFVKGSNHVQVKLLISIIICKLVSFFKTDGQSNNYCVFIFIIWYINFCEFHCSYLTTKLRIQRIFATIVLTLMWKLKNFNVSTKIKLFVKQPNSQFFFGS